MKDELKELQAKIESLCDTASYNWQNAKLHADKHPTEENRQWESYYLQVRNNLDSLLFDIEDVVNLNEPIETP